MWSIRFVIRGFAPTPSACIRLALPVRAEADAFPAYLSCVLTFEHPHKPRGNLEHPELILAHLILRDGDRVDVGHGGGDKGNIAKLRQELDGTSGRRRRAAQDAVVAGHSHVGET